MAENTSLQTTGSAQISRAETFAPRNIAEAFQFADMVLLSGMAPKSYLEIYDKALKDGLNPEAATMKAKSAVVVSLQFGMELNFQPMQALQCIANINGNPGVWGDGALALVLGSGLLEWIEEDDFDVIKANKKAVCQVKRRGDPKVKTITFSYEDAQKAGIFERGVWKTYPYRMALMRARAFALRDKFPDVLKGMKIAEELLDYMDIDTTPDPPKIAATVVVPTTETKPAENAPVAQTATATPTPSSSGQEEAPPTITIDQAKEFYKAYSASGYLPEEAKAFLKENYEYTGSDSRKVKVDDFEKVMVWANTKKGEQPKEPWTGTLEPAENMDAEPA